MTANKANQQNAISHIRRFTQYTYARKNVAIHSRKTGDDNDDHDQDHDDYEQ